MKPSVEENEPSQADYNAYTPLMAESNGDPDIDHQAHNRGAIRVGEWETGLFECFEHCVPNCYMATFCPCFSVAQISDRLGIMSYATVLVIYLIFYSIEQVIFFLALIKESINVYTLTGDERWEYLWSRSEYSSLAESTLRDANSWISIVAQIFEFTFVWHLRSKTRDRFQLPGSCCCDFFYTLCCTCCSIAQIATHVKSYKPGSCDFGPPDTLPAYPYDSTPRNYV